MTDFHEDDTVPVEQEEETVMTERPGYASTEQVTYDRASERRQTYYQISRGLWTIFSILDIVLVIRFVLKLIGANPTNSFADFMYRISAPFIAPFANLVGNPSAGSMLFEITTLIAILIYALVCWILVRVLEMFVGRPSARTITRTVQEQLPNTGSEHVTQVTRKD